MNKHQLIIHKVEAGKTAFNAHIQLEDHLIVDWGNSIEELKERISNLIEEQYPDQEFDFELRYDLS